MGEDRSKPVCPWIAILLIGLPMLYLASFGPACWLANSGNANADRAVHNFYGPLTEVGKRAYAWGIPLGYEKNPLVWYAGLNMADGLPAWTGEVEYFGRVPVRDPAP
jgi:hypothetical protein